MTGHVVAGTVRVDDTVYTVDLDGVACPERGEPMAKRARTFSTRTAFTRPVKLVTAEPLSGRNTIGEILMLDGRSLNAELVSRGLAWSRCAATTAA